MGRSGFWELCGKPLGPADYLALSREAGRKYIDSQVVGEDLGRAVGL